MWVPYAATALGPLGFPNPQTSQVDLPTPPLGRTSQATAMQILFLESPRFRLPSAFLSASARGMG